MPNQDSDRALIGEILLQRKKITPTQLEQALKIQQNGRGILGEILVKLGYLDERDIVVALIIQCGLPYISLTKYEIDPQIFKLIPVEVAREHHVIPLDRIGDVISVVMTNPLTDELREKLESITSCQVATFISTKTEIDEAIERAYRKG
ncbi:MAG: hypothetical protein KA403_02795 [Candidatus Omnitrophica bacterium]|nr:hypothetical protein [Candidatus Omnitrophota bacterium]